MKRLLCFIVALMLCLSSACAEEVRFNEEQLLIYEGETLRLRKRLTTILLLGIDQSEFTAGTYRNGGQADFQMLLVIDDNRKQVTALQLDRDTMTEITVLGILGHVTGERTAQLALAHAFGDGGELSCKLAVSAVENLLLNIPVDKYFAMNLDGIAAFNDALGGVEVTLEEDFSAFDPSMTKGATLRLQGVQAEYYVRQRFGIGDQTNASRLQRQNSYLTSARQVLGDQLHQSANFITVLFEAVEPYSVTNMVRGFMINTANKINKYDVLPIVQLPGEHRLGENGYMEFHPDSQALLEFVLETFCEPLPT